MHLAYCAVDLRHLEHVLSNCASSSALLRYTIRHNDVLRVLIGWLRQSLLEQSALYADLENASVQPVVHLFSGCRPDIAILDDKAITTLELTICHESNIVSSKQYKINRYANIGISVSSLGAGKTVVNFTMEVTPLGFMLRFYKIPTNFGHACDH